MERAPGYDLLVVTQSEFLMQPEFLARDRKAVFQDRRLSGASNLLCTRKGDRMGLWALMEGLGMSVEMTCRRCGRGHAGRNALYSRSMHGGSQGCAGGDRAGFDRLGDYYADDFMLATWWPPRAGKVVLSTHVIDHLHREQLVLRNLIINETG